MRIGRREAAAVWNSTPNGGSHGVNDLPLGIDMLYRTHGKYPWLDTQTTYPFSEEGIASAVADTMAMKTVKSTIVPWLELVS